MSSPPGPLAEIFGRLAYEFAELQPLIPTYLHLILSAIFPIYIGAHASLTRPSSAAKPKKKKKRERKSKHKKRSRKDAGEGDEAISSSSEYSSSEDEDEDEEADVIKRMEGLSPTDALLMPLLAGTTLAGLYFIIKWLQDPALLNKILNYYFGVFGVLSLSKLLADGMHVTHSLIFPRVWVGSRGVVYQVRQKERRAVPVAGPGAMAAQARNNPLPGVLSRIPLPQGVADFLWFYRALPTRKWTVKLYIRHLVAARTHIGLFGAVGAYFGILGVLYFNIVGKPWWLTNLMGFGFAYGALQIMSPTTFATGSLILSALFLYDIYFVFFTPMMVTVAKSLDIPIKLVFPRPSTTTKDGKPIRPYAMLGLGDVVLPGIMIGLALRFDLYMHYLKKQQKTSITSTAHSDSDGSWELTSAPVDKENEDGGDVTEKEARVLKAPYVSPMAHYGDTFWTSSWFGSRLLHPPISPTSSPTFRTPFALFRDSAFPKPYFNTSIVGYVLGLLVTLGVMQFAQHAQPALLYLVPGVLGSLALTAVWRGEVAVMWDYTEDVGSDDETKEKEDGKDEAGKEMEKREAEDNKKEKRTRSSFFSFASQDRYAERMERTLKQHVQRDDGNESSSDGKCTKSGVTSSSSKDRGNELLSFSISTKQSRRKSGSGLRRKAEREDDLKGTTDHKGGADGRKSEEEGQAGDEANLTPAGRRDLSRSPSAMQRKKKSEVDEPARKMLRTG